MGRLKGPHEGDPFGRLSPASSAAEGIVRAVIIIRFRCDLHLLQDQLHHGVLLLQDTAYFP